MKDVTKDWGVLNIQGPNSRCTLHALFSVNEIYCQQTLALSCIINYLENSWSSVVKNLDFIQRNCQKYCVVSFEERLV